MWVENYIKGNERSLEYFISLKQIEYIFYEKLNCDLRYIFRQYFDFKNKDIVGNRILIANNNKENITHYAEKDGYILYDLCDFDFNNIVKNIEKDIKKYKDMLEGIYNE